MSKRPRPTSTPKKHEKKQPPIKKTKSSNLMFQSNTLKKGPEKKEKVGALNGTAGAFGATTFTAATLLNALQQGATAVTREGRKVDLKSLYVRYSVALSATSTGGSPVRILIVYDKQTNGATPAITDVLLANDFHSPNNLNNADRFITLVDEITDVVSVNNNFSVSGAIYRKLGLETVFKDTSVGDVTDIISGGIFAFLAQNSAVGVANIQCISLTRVRFTDQ